MLLLNAVYFKGLWQYPFQLNNTKEGTFLTEENGPVNVEYMNTVQTLSFYDSPELKSVFLRLPYVVSIQEAHNHFIFQLYDHF